MTRDWARAQSAGRGRGSERNRLRAADGHVGGCRGRGTPRCSRSLPAVVDRRRDVVGNRSRSGHTQLEPASERHPGHFGYVASDLRRPACDDVPGPGKGSLRPSGIGHCDRRMLVSSLVLNWLVGPAVMFAWPGFCYQICLAYRTGLIIVGLARCIAMVLIWNDLSGGDREAAAVLVALELVVPDRRVRVPRLVLPEGPARLARAVDGGDLTLSAWQIAETVLIFLGVPLSPATLTRTIAERTRGRNWYESKFLPRLGPFALYGLLYTIVILFALQGHTITSRPADVARIALPLIGYFAVMWFGAFSLGRGDRACLTTAPPRLAFTAGGQQLRAGHRGLHRHFRATSGQALAGVVGPLIEVPVLVSLVYAVRPGVAHPPDRRGDRRWRSPMTGTPVASFSACTTPDGAWRQRCSSSTTPLGAVEGALRWHPSRAEQLNQSVVTILSERGLDASGESPKALTDDDARTADVVVTWAAATLARGTGRAVCSTGTSPTRQVSRSRGSA